MTDAQLDEFLATGNGELLDHLEATTDTNQLLTDLMSPGDGERRPAEPAAPAMGHNPNRPSAREAIRKRTLADDLVGELGRALNLARASTRDLLRTRALDLDRAHSLDRALNLAGALALDLDRDLALALARALDLDRTLNSALNLDITRASTFVSGLVRWLDRAVSLARDAALGLRAEQVDASGADLSDVEVGDIEALDGVVWTRQTIWPPGIARQVEAHSEEIGDGVYRVRLGRRDEARMY
jgi:hypothetical protein